MPEPSWYPADFGSAIHEAIHDAGVYEGPGDHAGSGDEPDLDGAATAEQVAPTAADPPHDSGFTGWTTGQAALRDGEIVVTATDFGLLLSVHVDSGQLRRDPVDLADDLLRLCRLATDRAGSARRAELTRLGLTDGVLDLLGLPTRDAVEQTEIDDEDKNDYEPRSWLEQNDSSW